MLKQDCTVLIYKRKWEAMKRSVIESSWASVSSKRTTEKPRDIVVEWTSGNSHWRLKSCPRLRNEVPPTAFRTDTLTLTFNPVRAMVMPYTQKVKVKGHSVHECSQSCYCYWWQHVTDRTSNVLMIMTILCSGLVCSRPRSAMLLLHTISSFPISVTFFICRTSAETSGRGLRQ